MLAAQLARPVVPVMPNQQNNDYPKREVPVLNGSQVKQIRIVNGNGEPVVIQQATTSVVETNQTTIKTETQQPIGDETVKEDTPAADETNSTMGDVEDDEDEEKMEIDESNADQSVDNADLTQDDQQIESVIEVETTIVEEKTELIVDESNLDEDVDEEVEEQKTVPNGSGHKDEKEHPVLNGVDHKSSNNNNGTVDADSNEEPNEEEIENGPVLNGTQSNKHPKENGCVKSNDEEEKPVLNGSIKKSKSKAKKRSLPVDDSNGSPKAKKSKTTPKKKAQKNGYIEPKETEETETPASETPNDSAPQTVYVRVPNFLCEWEACTKYFHTGAAMIYHILHDHIDEKPENDPTDADQAPTTSNPSTSNSGMSYCRWPGCERTPRNRWSLVTHLQENHCNDNALNMATRKRREIGDFNYIANIKQRLQEITPAIHHPGYTKFAAYDAIRRHAFNYMTRDITVSCLLSSISISFVRFRKNIKRDL